MTLNMLFGLLLVNFLVLLGPMFFDFLQGNVFLLLMFSFFGLGASLLFKTWKSKMRGWERKVLLLTSGSAVGFFVGVVAHNLLYAAAEISKDVWLLNMIFEVLHVGFFLFAVVACLLGFLVGVVGRGVIVAGKYREKKK